MVDEVTGVATVTDGGSTNVLVMCNRNVTPNES